METESLEEMFSWFRYIEKLLSSQHTSYKEDQAKLQESLLRALPDQEELKSFRLKFVS
jgi:hypothetical protein